MAELDLGGDSRPAGSSVVRVCFGGYILPANVT